MTALMVCILFSASSKTTDCLLSKTSSVTSNSVQLNLVHFSLATLVFKSWKAGKQWRKMQVGLALSIQALVTLYGELEGYFTNNGQFEFTNTEEFKFSKSGGESEAIKTTEDLPEIQNASISKFYRPKTVNDEGDKIFFTVLWDANNREGYDLTYFRRRYAEEMELIENKDYFILPEQEFNKYGTTYYYNPILIDLDAYIKQYALVGDEYHRGSWGWTPSDLDKIQFFNFGSNTFQQDFENLVTEADQYDKVCYICYTGNSNKFEYTIRDNETEFASIVVIHKGTNSYNTSLRQQSLDDFMVNQFETNQYAWSYWLPSQLDIEYITLYDVSSNNIKSAWLQNCYEPQTNSFHILVRNFLLEDIDNNVYYTNDKISWKKLNTRIQVESAEDLNNAFNEFYSDFKYSDSGIISKVCDIKPCDVGTFVSILENSDVYLSVFNINSVNVSFKGYISRKTQTIDPESDDITICFETIPVHLQFTKQGYWDVSTQILDEDGNEIDYYSAEFITGELIISKSKVPQE